MAFLRTKTTAVIGDSLDSFVTGVIATYTAQSKARNTIEEAAYNKLVLEQGLSLADQLDYRKKQVAAVADDPNEVLRVNGEIASLKKQIRNKELSDGYTKQLQDHAAGIESTDQVIAWLRDQISNETDDAVKTQLNTELSTQLGNKFTQTQNMLVDQTNYAVKDKTMPVLNAQIAKVTSAKNAALLGGDKATAASLDLQLQSLTQAKTAASITKDIQSFAAATVSGHATATDLLDAYNKKISQASLSGMVSINGVSYANAKEYWTFTRDSYISDNGGTGFFPRVNEEMSTAIKVKQSNNTLNPTDITTTQKRLDALVGRPELEHYQARLDAVKQDVMQTAADFIAKKTTQTYGQDFNLNKSISALSSLQAQGVNVDDAMNQVLLSAAQTQAGTVQNIMAAANALRQANPSLSITAAVAAAVKQGAGTVLSPNSLLGKDPAASATDALGAKVADQTQTLDPGNLPGVGLPPGAAPGTAGAGGAYVVKAGDTLSKIALAHGTTVAELTKANKIADPNRINVGLNLTIPTAAPTTPTAPTVKPAASTIDYKFDSRKETISQYNARIAKAQADARGSSSAPISSPAPTGTSTSLGGTSTKKTAKPATPVTPTSAPKTKTPTPVNYYYDSKKETIPQYNARVAREQAANH